jgi:hypothetical protein
MAFVQPTLPDAVEHFARRQNEIQGMRNMRSVAHEQVVVLLVSDYAMMM